MVEANVLTKSELKQMADIMSESFIDHQNWSYLIPKVSRRKRSLNRIFLMMYKVINEYGYITTISVDEKPVGYLTFMDDSDPKQISFWRVLRTGGLFDFIKFLFGLNFKELRGIVSYMKTYNGVRKTNKDHTMHLYMVGVLKEHRGNGYMSRAFRDMTTFFQEEGIKQIILETSDESNIPIYKKMNFKLDEFVKSKKNNQTIYFFTLEI